MNFTLAQYNIIRELIEDEVDAVGCDLANMEERFKTNFPADDEAVKETSEYRAKAANIEYVRERYNELNRILDKFNEVEF